MLQAIGNHSYQLNFDNSLGPCPAKVNPLKQPRAFCKSLRDTLMKLVSPKIGSPSHFTAPLKKASCQNARVFHMIWHLSIWLWLRTDFRLSCPNHKPGLRIPTTLWILFCWFMALWMRWINSATRLTDGPMTCRQRLKRAWLSCQQRKVYA